jgi:hypothetical protein
MRRRFVGGPLGRSDKEEDGDRGAFSTDYEYCVVCVRSTIKLTSAAFHR